MIQTKNLTKKYGDFTALDDVNLNVPEGSIFGFLGHNGAGKTTMISLLTTLILPTSGSAEIAGYDIVKNNLKVRRLSGYLPESVMFYGELTAAENLRYFGELSGIEKIEKRIDETLELIGFQEWKNKKIREFSKGMRQRIGIAQAILHKPEILFLDEPASGLDPEGIRDMRELLQKINRERKTTIFMSTHLLSEAVKMCTDIGVIRHGKLVLSEKMETVKSRFEGEGSLEEFYFGLEEGKNG